MNNKIEEVSRILPLINDLMKHFNCNANIAFNDNDYQVNLIFKEKKVCFQENSSDLLQKRLTHYLTH